MAPPTPRHLPRMLYLRSWYKAAAASGEMKDVWLDVFHDLDGVAYNGARRFTGLFGPTYAEGETTSG